MTMNKNKYVKSPMNYPGNKYKLLNQILPLFPSSINNFIDLFCGGLDITCNVTANIKYANDIDSHIIDIYKAFQQINYDDLIKFINNRINEFNLTRYNYEGFINNRNAYNKNENYHTPLDLFTLSRFSFNNLIRFRNNNYDGQFGYDHSDFNITQQAHTKFLHTQISKVKFSSLNFINFNLDNFTADDFLYVDPPYLISYNMYQNNESWTEEKEHILYNYLDNANKKGIKWGVSNLIAHKGNVNTIFSEWAEHYNIHDIYSNYSNSFYSNKSRNQKDFSIEVFVTNY